MTEDIFNPEAKDGDSDGVVQEGTPFERPAEELDVNPVENDAEVVVESIEEEPEIVKAPEPEDEAPAIVPVVDGVIGTGKVRKKKSEPKPKAEPVKEAVTTVALFASRNLVWQGLGKLVKGYNIVSVDAADKWLTLDSVRSVDPSEVQAKLG
jgi:hypothetical protein